MAVPLSHGIVLPDKDFNDWVNAVRPYMAAFERVAVIRGPAGNNLNRFRNITAVQAPGVWVNGDARAHVERAYRMVVRIDVIVANTPDELAAELQNRINTNDRFGEQRNTPQHIFDRFILEWPSTARPARILQAFSMEDKHEGIDITTYPGTPISAVVGGTVTKVVTVNDSLNYGAYVQISTQHEGYTYITTYAGLGAIAVSEGQAVAVGNDIAVAAGDAIRVVVQKINGGMKGFNLPDVVDPTNMVYWQGLRVRPTVGALRIRDAPGLHGNIIGTISSSDLVETHEMHGRTLAKVGVEDEWLRIHRPGVDTAYTAAWYLEARGVDDAPEGIEGVAIPGMNIDLDGNLHPSPANIKKLGWVRLLFNVSLNPTYPEGDERRYGNTDVNFTYNRYLSYIQQYANQGIKVILVFTHQTFGEGQWQLGYYWPTMSSEQWRDLTTRFADIVRQTAQKFANTGLIYAYQIWNEQDTDPAHARAAVPIPAVDYANMLSETIKAIRSVDKSTKIITGGHVSGVGSGVDYAKTTLANMQVGIQPDGIAFHPYGLGPAGNRFSPWGTISYAIEQFERVMPNTLLWITEWGVLDRQNDYSIITQVSDYADGFLSIISNDYPGKIACACWYAWADGMDNGYGLVKPDNQPKQPLYDEYLNP